MLQLTLRGLITKLCNIDEPYMLIVWAASDAFFAGRFVLCYACSVQSPAFITARPNIHVLCSL
jgi:hypothetical protein